MQITDLTIGISTFRARYDLLKNLVKNIRTINNSIPIIISVNGEPDEPFDEDYRRRVLQLAADTPKTSVIMFTEMRSLSKLWNSMIVASTTEYVYVLNDDCRFENPNVFDKLISFANETGEQFFLCPHHSFSHFVITKTMADELGYFDERLLGVGEEDGDMLWRFLQHTGKTEIKGITGLQGIGNIGAYTGHSKKMKVHTQNKAKFNQDFIYQEKYKKEEGGLRGMFDYGMRQVLPNEKQYPYEKFFKENKRRLIDE